MDEKSASQFRAAIDGLAIALHKSMEKRDPSDAQIWDQLTSKAKDFYRGCIEDLLYEKAYLEAALTIFCNQRQPYK
jgi:hypothetical protein